MADQGEEDSQDGSVLDMRWILQFFKFCWSCNASMKQRSKATLKTSDDVMEMASTSSRSVHTEQQSPRNTKEKSNADNTSKYQTEKEKVPRVFPVRLFPARVFPDKDQGLKCGDDCPNRRSRVECDESCGASCSNRRIQKKQYSKCLRIDSRPEFGMCLVTFGNISAGDYVVQVIGVIEVGKVYQDQPYCFPFPDHEELYVNNSKKGNEGRFVKHSEQPNCKIERWIVQKKLHLIVVALEDIPAGEVITVSLPQFSQETRGKYEKLNEAEMSDSDAEVATELSEMAVSSVQADSNNGAFDDYVPKGKRKVGDKMKYPFACRIKDCKETFQTENALDEHSATVHFAVLPDIQSDAEGSQKGPFFHKRRILQFFQFYFSYKNAYAPAEAAKGQRRWTQKTLDDLEAKMKASRSSRSSHTEQQSTMATKENGKILKMIYADIAPKYPKKKGKVITCGCPEDEELDFKCGEGCSYRRLGIECAESCGASCSNRRIQKKQHSIRARVDSRPNFVGFCLVTLADISAGDYVVEVVGEFLVGKVYQDQRYSFPLSDSFSCSTNVYLNNSEFGNQGRYVQHSEQPNCKIEEWIVQNELHLIVIALEDIPAGEVITVSLPQFSQETRGNYKQLTDAEITEAEMAKEMYEMSLADAKPDSNTGTFQALQRKRKEQLIIIDEEKEDNEGPQRVVWQYFRFHYSYTNSYAAVGIPEKRQRKGNQKTLEDDKEKASTSLRSSHTGQQSTKDAKESGKIFKLIYADIASKYPKKKGNVKTCGCLEDEDRGLKCGEGCRNRRLRIECDESCGASCSNRKIQKKQYSKHFGIGSRNFYGFCLVTFEDISAGDFVVEVVGEFQVGKLYQNQPYSFPLSDSFSCSNNVYLNSSEFGNEGRFVKHSEQPNCKIEEWIVQNELHLIVVALVDIPAGEVITVSLPQFSQETRGKYKQLTEAEITEAEVAKEMAEMSLTDAKAESNSKSTFKAPNRKRKLADKRKYPFDCHFKKNCKERFETEKALDEHCEKVHYAVLPDVLSHEEKVEYKTAERIVGERLACLIHDYDFHFATPEEQEEYFKQQRARVARARAELNT